jgi:hypothetical protein
MNKETIEKLQAKGISNLEEKQAVIDRIDRIVFRAETALYNEISLAYDEAALAETREERTPYLDRVIKCEAALKALVTTAKKVIAGIVCGERKCEVEGLFKELEELPDDDDAIVERLVYTGEEAMAMIVKMLADKLEEALEGDGDEC